MFRLCLFLARKEGRKDLACSANHHLFLPVFLDNAFTNRPVYKPADLPGPEFPSRTLFFSIWRALLYHPAWFDGFVFTGGNSRQENELSFNMSRNTSPPLLIALNSLDRGPKQLGKFFLGLAQSLSEVYKFLLVHVLPSKFLLGKKKSSLDTTLWYDVSTTTFSHNVR